MREVADTLVDFTARSRLISQRCDARPRPMLQTGSPPAPPLGKLDQQHPCCWSSTPAAHEALDPLRVALDGGRSRPLTSRAAKLQPESQNLPWRRVATSHDRDFFTGRTGVREVREGRERIFVFGGPKPKIFPRAQARGHCCTQQPSGSTAAARAPNLGSQSSRSPDLPVKSRRPSKRAISTTAARSLAS
jgi:hypothetical protein